MVVLWLGFSVQGSCWSMQIVGIPGETAPLSASPFPGHYRKPQRGSRVKENSRGRRRCPHGCFVLLRSELLKRVSCPRILQVQCLWKVVCSGEQKSSNCRVRMAWLWDVLAAGLWEHLRAVWGQASAFRPSASFFLSLETKCSPSRGVFQAVPMGHVLSEQLYPSPSFLMPLFLTLCVFCGTWA